MAIKNYDELSSLELDTLKEIGSIGTGNAATSLSALIGMPVRIQTPEVRIMGYNEAIEWIGGPEEITAGEDREGLYGAPGAGKLRPDRGGQHHDLHLYQCPERTGGH